MRDVLACPRSDLQAAGGWAAREREGRVLSQHGGNGLLVALGRWSALGRHRGGGTRLPQGREGEQRAPEESRGCPSAAHAEMTRAQHTQSAPRVARARARARVFFPSGPSTRMPVCLGPLCLSLRSPPPPPPLPPPELEDEGWSTHPIAQFLGFLATMCMIFVFAMYISVMAEAQAGRRR